MLRCEADDCRGFCVTEAVWSLVGVLERLAMLDGLVCAAGWEVADVAVTVQVVELREVCFIQVRSDADCGSSLAPTLAQSPPVRTQDITPPSSVTNGLLRGHFSLHRYSITRSCHRLNMVACSTAPRASRKIASLGANILLQPKASLPCTEYHQISASSQEYRPPTYQQAVQATTVDQHKLDQTNDVLRYHCCAKNNPPHWDRAS